MIPDGRPLATKRRDGIIVSEPDGKRRNDFAEWWTAHRDRASILLIGGVALGGMVCMIAVVLAIVMR